MSVAVIWSGRGLKQIGLGDIPINYPYRDTADIVQSIEILSIEEAAVFLHREYDSV